MPAFEKQIFVESPVLHVRDVTLLETDATHTYREKLARIILDEMYQFVGLLDADGNVLDINRVALQGAGIRLDEIQGKPFWDARWWVVSEKTQNLQRALVEQARAGHFVRQDIEIYGEAAGEKTIIIDYSLEPVRDRGGKVFFLLAEGRNITEKKRAEAEIARKNEDLQQLVQRIQELDRLKTDFFANVSHELRTPLALILGPAESILSAGENLTDLQRRDLHVIQRNATTLLKHVNDLLDLSKLDAGQHSVDYARVDLARHMRTGAAHFDALAPQRSLSYVVVAPGSLEAEVDPDKFDRILLNLLSNAFKFTPPGGRIRCALESAGADRVLLSVQDSGPGVKREMRSTIFERFRQAQSGNTREFGGTGLGLAIARNFAELHGGSIALTDAPGGGALFQVELPRYAPESACVRAPETEAAMRAVPGIPDELKDAPPEMSTGDDLMVENGRAERPRVLVVEDNPEMRRFIAGVLGDEYYIMSAANGEEALARVIARAPDIVVTDLMMPKMGGDRLVAELRSRPTLALMPIIILSAKADEELRVKLLSESVQDYLVKPFSAHELRARVRNQIALKRARDVLQRELDSQSSDVMELSRQLAESRAALKRSLEAQTEAAGLWRAVFENSAVGVALLNTDGRFLETNPRLQVMTGLDREELSRMSLLDIVGDEKGEAVAAQIAGLMTSGVTGNAQDLRYHFRNGNSGWACMSLSVIPASGLAHRMLVGAFDDITARKRAEEEQEKLVSLAENSTDFIGIASMDGQATFVNRAGRKVVGLGLDDDVTQFTIDDFLPESERNRMHDAILPQLRRDGQWEGEILFRNFRPGQAIPMWQHIFFITNGSGRRMAIGTVSRDLTDRKESEARIEAAQSQLAHMARVTTMGEMAAAIAHEINQPLAAVVINANACMRWLSAATPDLDEARAAASRIAAEGTRASEVVARIRALMKKRPARNENLDLNGVIEQVLDLVRSQLLRHRISLRLELLPNLPLIRGDAIQLQQVVLNLIVNAIEATAGRPDGERDVVVLTERLPQGEVSMSVRDSGTGIDAAELGQIFQPFYTTKPSGMGMGLAISRTIIEAHRGRLWATANQPDGSTFLFSIPAMAAA